VGDDQLLWETSVVSLGIRPFRLIWRSGAYQSITLEVRDGGDGIDFDHANWVNARFSGRVDGITAWKPVIEKAEILTPSPGQSLGSTAPAFGVCVPATLYYLKSLPPAIAP
jgi:hypothetical protein